MPAIKQWVNLDPTWPEIRRDTPEDGVIPPERCGPEITLEATITATVSGTRLAGRPIWWGVELGGDNLVPDMSANPGWTNRMDAGGFGGARGLYEIPSITGTSGSGDNIATASFTTSGCGGDQYTFKAYTKDASGNIETEIQEQTYEVWRQLYYQVTRMGADGDLPEIPDLEWAAFEAEFERLFRNIRWSAVPASQEIITRHRTVHSNTILWDVSRDGYDRSRDDPALGPITIKVSLVDIFSDRDVERYTFEAVRRGDEPIEHTFQGMLFDNNSANDRDDWLYDFTGRDRNNPDREIGVSDSDLEKTGPRTVQFTPPANLPRCRRGNMALIVNVFAGLSAGGQALNSVVIANTDVSDDRRNPQIINVENEERLSTALHEFGHALGMVLSTSSTYYTDHNHVGPHCHTGIAAADMPSPGMGFHSDYRPTCLMFGATTHESVTNQFCTTCGESLRHAFPLNSEMFTEKDPIPTTGVPP